MDDIEITAGQLHVKNATYMIEFMKQDTLEIIGRPFISFNIWMSFDAIPDFKIANVFIGEPFTDYHITVSENEASQLGVLKEQKPIMEYFKLFTSYILTSGKEFNIYDLFFKDDPVLTHLMPTFNDTTFSLIDRYVSVFFNPNFGTLLQFLREVVCVEEFVKNISGSFWKIVCVNLPGSKNLKSEGNEQVREFLKDTLEDYDNKVQ
jgi:hypothetical protein